MFVVILVDFSFRPSLQLVTSLTAASEQSHDLKKVNEDLRIPLYDPDSALIRTDIVTGRVLQFGRY